MGRPPKPPEEKTTIQLGVRLTDEQRRKLDELVTDLDVPAAEILRMGLDEFYERWLRRKRRP